MREGRDAWSELTRFPLEFFFVRSATLAARFFLVVGAIATASCHHGVTNVTPAASVTVAPTTISLLVGDTLTFTASESDVNGILLRDSP